MLKCYICGECILFAFALLKYVLSLFYHTGTLGHDVLAYGEALGDDDLVAQTLGAEAYELTVCDTVLVNIPYAESWDCRRQRGAGCCP